MKICYIYVICMLRKSGITKPNIFSVTSVSIIQFGWNNLSEILTSSVARKHQFEIHKVCMNRHKLTFINLRKQSPLRYFSLSINFFEKKSSVPSNKKMDCTNKDCDPNQENQKLPKKYYRRAEHSVILMTPVVV